MNAKNLLTTLGSAFMVGLLARVEPMLENGPPTSWKAVVLAGVFAGLASSFHLYQQSPSSTPSGGAP